MSTGKAEVYSSKKQYANLMTYHQDTESQLTMATNNNNNLGSTTQGGRGRSTLLGSMIGSQDDSSSRERKLSSSGLKDQDHHSSHFMTSFGHSVVAEESLAQRM